MVGLVPGGKGVVNGAKGIIKAAAPLARQTTILGSAAGAASALRKSVPTNFFRGGTSLQARLGVDVKAAADGLIHPLAKNGKAQGLSININPKDLFIQKYGGAFPLKSLPDGLQVIQSGKPGHYVIAPEVPMPFEDFQKLLDKIELGDFNIVL
jgi:hypothetical protein